MRNVANHNENLDARQSLYCVWIAASEQPNAPLVCVWIEPVMRTFERELQEVSCEASMGPGVAHECENESKGDGVVEEPPLCVHIPVMSASLA